MLEWAIASCRAFAVLQPLVAITFLAQYFFGDVRGLAHVARSFVAKLVPAPSLKVSLDKGNQVLVVLVFMTDGQTFVMRHVLAEPWVPLNLAPEQSFQNVVVG